MKLGMTCWTPPVRFKPWRTCHRQAAQHQQPAVVQQHLQQQPRRVCPNLRCSCQDRHPGCHDVQQPLSTVQTALACSSCKHAHVTVQAADVEYVLQVTIMEDEEQNIHFKNLSVHRAATEEEALNLVRHMWQLHVPASKPQLLPCTQYLQRTTLSAKVTL